MSSGVDDAYAAPSRLRKWWANPPGTLAGRLYRPAQYDPGATSLESALVALRTSTMSAPGDLFPVTFVDDRSFACLALADNVAFGWRSGEIVRWHLDDIDLRFQGALLDRDLDLYLSSLAEEFGPAWRKGYEGLIELADRYASDYVEKEITPKPHDLRPFQLACQNVIIGLAAFQRDASLDGLAVPYWQTCDVPHVATHEGNRALSALMLCDAFQSGGTMEVSFARHPEHRVPASLRRFGRSLGIALGEETPGGKSISPSEARALFWAVTPMPSDLRDRCQLLVDAGICSVERLCYSLLSPVWSARALDFLIACGSGARVASILEGGALVEDRAARAPEMELMRAALTLEMLIRRLDSKDAAGIGEVAEDARLFEDTTFGVRWRVLGDIGAVEIGGFPSGPVPWLPTIETDGKFVVLPRPHPLFSDFELARSLARSDEYRDTPVVVLAAQDTGSSTPDDIEVAHCPARLAELDLQIERNLVAASLGRA